MKIATWNVNGIRARQLEFDLWVRQTRPDVICLQEIKALAEQVPPALCELEGYWCAWHGAKGYSGVGLHIAKSISPERPQVFHPPFDHESRIVAARLPGFTVISVYVPNGGKDLAAKMEFLHQLHRWTAARVAEGEEVIICGDLNVARADIDVHPKQRDPTAIGQLPQERALFDAILAAGLRDVTRDLDPDNDRLFTWWAPWRNLRQRNIGWRIDYLLATAGWATRAATSRADREFGSSDHAPLVTSFEPAAAQSRIP
ncbi:MAG: exodeoxyribonuclease III [Pseudomonadota bacterium]